MYNKCLTYLIVILLISTCFMTVSCNIFAEKNNTIQDEIKGDIQNNLTKYSISSNLSVEKKVWNKITEEWGENITAKIGENVRFNISIKYSGKELLYNISVNDTLPYCLEYNNNSSIDEPDINSNNLFWYLQDTYLFPNEILYIEFDAKIISQDIGINSVIVKAIECGNITELNSSDTAIVNCISDLEVNANANPKQIYEGEYVSFTGTVSGGISPYSWSWDFNDGTTDSNQQNPKHQFHNPGQYEVTLTVVDYYGDSDSDKVNIIVLDDLPPTIEIVQPLLNSIYFWNTYLLPSERNTILIGKTNITVDANDDLGVEKVEFYLDDNIQYTDYDEPYNWVITKGHLKHDIKISVYDSSGQETNIQFEVLQWKIHPIFILMILNRIHKNRDNQLNWINNEKNWNSYLIYLLQNMRNIDESSKMDINNIIQILREKNEDLKTSIIINFLNNHPLIRSKFKDTYPLIYFILFYIKNDDGIFINNDMNSIFKEKTPIESLLSKSSLFKLKSSSEIFNQDIIENTHIQWIIDHPLFTIGTIILISFLIKQIQSNKNNEDENDTEPEIENIAPIAKIDASYEGIINTSITFSAENSYDQDGIINSYEWDFGDGNTGTGVTIKHTYKNSGIFTIKLTVTDDQGKSDYDTLKIEIKTNNSESNFKEDEDANQYLIISGALSSVLLIGIILLKFRRKYFE